MKIFKTTLLLATTALLLQGCGDDSDSSSSTTIIPPNINAELVGIWSSDDDSGDLLAISFMDDGTYVQVEVNSSESMNDPEGGMEWGKYTINSKTGKLTTTQLFDKNGDMGLSDNLALSARISDGKLILEVDENNNGVIDSNETIIFSKTKPKGILGYWSGAETDDELESVAFFEDGTYIHVQVDEDKSLSNPENGMEWGTYTIDATTGRLETSQLYDDNGSNGLSEPRTRYARVSGDTALAIDVDSNQNGMIEDDEIFEFSRSSSSSEPSNPTNLQDLLGLWRMNLGNQELVTLAFLDDGTYVQTQVTGTTSSRDPNNGIEWGKYSLKANNELKIDDVIYDNNGTFGLSDNVLRTIQISGNMMTLGVDENDNGVIDSNESYAFSKAKSENILGFWRNKSTDNDLLALAFFEDGTYVHMEVDEKPPYDSESSEMSGMEWGNYSVNNTTKLLTTSTIFDNNGGTGFSGIMTRYARVSSDTLTLEFDENRNGVIDSDESIDFQRQ